MQTVRGPRLWWIISALWIALLLASLEGTIVSTALVSFATEFNDYERSNWVVIVYLVTYSSFSFVYARLSDFTGRKSALIFGLALYTIASLACGLARSLNQLVIFRAFQGIGGSGIFALAFVISAEITPREQYGIVSGLIGLVFATASAVGPVIGGAITSNTTWRWCFYFNVPSTTLVILVVGLVFPGSLRSDPASNKSLRHVDWFGCFLCLAASMMTVVPLQEGGAQFAWDSPPIIAMFVIGGSCWFTFATWETWLTYRKQKGRMVPMLPVRVVSERVIAACIVSSMLTGLAFTSTIIYLPQRFQVADDLSPGKAGINFLPLVISSALASTVAGPALTLKNICAYLLIGASALQLVGLGLISTIRDAGSVPSAMFGYQVILGIGVGTALSSSFILARIEVSREDIATTMGAITQLRVFGGVIGVALCRVILSSDLNQHLPQIVSADELTSIVSSVESINQLLASQAASVRQVYGEGFALQFRVLMYIACANVVISLFSFRLHATPIKEADTPEEEVKADKEVNAPTNHDQKTGQCAHSRSS